MHVKQTEWTTCTLIAFNGIWKMLIDTLLVVPFIILCTSFYLRLPQFLADASARLRTYNEFQNINRIGKSVNRLKLAGASTAGFWFPFIYEGENGLQSLPMMMVMMTRMVMMMSILTSASLLPALSIHIYSPHLNHYTTSATLHQESYCWEVRLAVLQYSFKALVDLLVSPLLIPLVLTQYRWWPISAPLRQSSDLNLKELYMIVQVSFVFFSLLLLSYYDSDANTKYTNLCLSASCLFLFIYSSPSIAFLPGISLYPYHAPPPPPCV